MHAPLDASLGPAVRRAILGLGVTQIIGWGTTYYLLSLLAGKIGDDLDISSAWALGGASVPLICAAIFGPAIGRWQDRAGSRIVMAAGSIVTAIGLAVLSRAASLWSYYLAWTIIGIGGPMALYSAAFTALTQIAGHRARRAISFLTFMGGLASTIFWPFTAFLMQHYGWREIIMMFAGLNLAVCLPLHILLLNGRESMRDGAEHAATVEPGIPQEAFALAFVLFALLLAFNGLIFNSWSLLVFPVLEGLGFLPAAAVFVGSLVGIFQVAGRMGEMLFGSRYSVMITAMVSATCLPAAFAVLLGSGGVTGIGVAFAVLYGISNGLLTIARGGLTLAMFGSRGYGERLNRITVSQNTAGAIAPILGGLMLDHLGAKALVSVMFAIAFVSLALMIALRSHCARHGLH